MISRRMAIAALAALLLAVPALAQEAGTLEAGVFGRSNLLDQDLHLDGSTGLGARLGYFFFPRLALEVDGSYARVNGPSPSNDVDVLPLHGRLIYGLPAGDRVSVLLGAGYSRFRYGRDADGWDDGVGGLLGVRLHGCGPLSFRLEGTVDHFADSDLIADDASSATNWGIQFGASWFFGGGAGTCDRDRDGVPDNKDLCPDTPFGEAVDASGCPLPKDSDGDGVLDPQDNCPHTPKGERVDANGCPLPKDSDGDGVLDPQDNCPNTPKGTRVDAKGCPVAQLFEEGQKEIVLRGVNFETAKAVLTPGSQMVLDQVAEALIANPDVKVEVAGYTDDRGALAMNLKLSQARADAVRDYLVGKGVAASRLAAKGYGPDDPVATNATAEGRAANRRVELKQLD